MVDYKAIGARVKYYRKKKQITQSRCLREVLLKYIQCLKISLLGH